VVKQKRNDDGTIKYRVRGTAEGNLLDVPYDVLARTASLDVVKLLLQSTVSDNKSGSRSTSKTFTWELPSRILATNMYALSGRNYLLSLSPPTTYSLSSTTMLFTSGSVNACTASRKLAVRLSQLRLISHLAKHGYHQSPNTPCLFQHQTLVVTLAGYCVCSTTVPCSTRFVFSAPSDEKTVIGLKVGGGRPLYGKLRM
jgi:hypothetical protein